MAGIRDYMTRRAAEDQRQHEYTRKAEERIREVDETLDGLTDEAALEVTGAFRHWEPDIDVVAGERLQHIEKLWKCVQGHRTQAGWEPDMTPALFTEVAKPGEIPVWKQPTGAQDAYRIGAKVHYPDKEDPVYINNVDYNIYAPDVYGWTKEG